MSKTIGTVVIDTERCKGCNLCVMACPVDVLGLAKEVNRKGYPFALEVVENTCIGCASCAIVCPDACITVYKKRIKEEELWQNQTK